MMNKMVGILMTGLAHTGTTTDRHGLIILFLDGFLHRKLHRIPIDLGKPIEWVVLV